MKYEVRVALQFSLVVMSGLTLAAHHDVRQVYDAATVVPLTGVIRHVQLTNPHVIVSLDAMGSDGRVQTWAIELPTPGALKRRAFDFQLLAAGRQVVIESWLKKDGQRGEANGRTLVLPDGRRFDVGDNWVRSMTFPAE